MLMPIVSMNKMAMNESVATTCCFRQVSTPTAVYWEVLHGGWIGSGYVTKLVYREGYGRDTTPIMHTSWLNSSFGKDLTGPDAALSVFVRDNVLVYGARGTTFSPQYWVNSIGYLSDWASLETQIKSIDNRLGVGSACDHKNGNCKYRTLVYAYETNQHFESKTKHADLSDWQDPHGARQFSS